MKTVVWLGGVALVASVTAFKYDLSTLMRLKAMERQFKEDDLEQDQRVALMEVAGYADMDLFLSKVISADEFKTSMKREMKDRMITQILQGGGIDISNPIWRRTFFDNKDDAELFTDSMDEPMRSILRLTKEGSADAKQYGKDLLKKWQFKSFNSPGSYLSENFDHILLADDKSAMIKEILQQQWIESIDDPIDRAMMYQLQQQKEASSAEKAILSQNIKDLQTIKIFQGSIPEVSPVSADQLYTFYQITNGGQVDASAVLNIALGDSLAPISDLDFERYFGSPAKQFSCRAHERRIKVPCGINPTANECLTQGCCYQPNTDASVPNCFRDLYGKIGSAVLRRAFIKADRTDEDDPTTSAREDEIAKLFVGGAIPALSDILRYDLPYGLKDADGALHATRYGDNSNWWTVSEVEGEDGKTAHPIFPAKEDRPRYGRPGFEWKPHGPTQSPYFDRMPGVNPTAAPGSGFEDLNDYYKMWLAYAAAQDEAQCALVAPAARIKCMENYDALAAKADMLSTCQDMGCCFNEDSFLEGNHACYRASDYGTCDKNMFPDEFKKRNCGYEGITEKQCLNNPRCCYFIDFTEESRGDPYCFYKYSATIDESEWCTAWHLKENRNLQRSECFKGTSSNLFTDGQNTIGNVNNLVSKEQCEAADCCYDETLTYDALEWIKNGLGRTDKMYRCFDKKSPDEARAAGLIIGGYVLVDGNLVEDGRLTEIDPATGLPAEVGADGIPITNPATGLPFEYITEKRDPSEFKIRQKTCDVNDWMGLTFKRSCGEKLSYYQCVYVNRCCYRATTSNEPVCYQPEFAKTL